MASAHDYARIYRTQSVLTTGPGQLVLMLYDGALRFIGQARDAMKEPEDAPHRIEKIHTGITKAQNILAELQSNLNFEAGDYARDLDRLYTYYLERLFEANVKKSSAPLDEVDRLLRLLRDGWSEMLRQSGPQISDARLSA